MAKMTYKEALLYLAQLAGSGGGGGSGLTAEQKALIIAIMRSGVYSTDQKDNIDLLEQSFGGEPTPPTEILTVTADLTNTQIDNQTVIVQKNQPYTATLTAEEDYELSSVVITMGGVNVTDSVYANGTIYIGAVTGNIIITAISEAVMTEIDYAAYSVEVRSGSYKDVFFKDLSVFEDYDKLYVATDAHGLNYSWYQTCAMWGFVGNDSWKGKTLPSFPTGYPAGAAWNVDINDADGARAYGVSVIDSATALSDYNSRKEEESGLTKIVYRRGSGGNTNTKWAHVFTKMPTLAQLEALDWGT